MDRQDRLLVWGFQGTVDHKVRLARDDFLALGFVPPALDLELFVSAAEVSDLLQKLAVRGTTVISTPGGSPLVSALTAARLCEREALAVTSRFAGNLPKGIAAYLDQVERAAIADAVVNPLIGATLALEYAPASAKLMLAVAEGRRLDATLAVTGLKCLQAMLRKASPSLVCVGIGGLNKADPLTAARLTDDLQTLLPSRLLMVTGSSFRQDLDAGRPRAHWAALRKVFAAAEVISVSETEEAQLAAVWGEGWVDELLLGRTKLVVSHSPGGQSTRCSPALADHLEDAQALVGRAGAEAAAAAAVSLTGIGARFDGVLSSLVLANWHS